MPPRSKTTKPSRAAQVRAWIESLTPQQAECRDTSIHHAWQASTVERAEHGFNRTLICPRCGAIKQQRLDFRGNIIPGANVHYEPGYVRPKGTGFSTKADNAAVRLHNLQRMAGPEPNGTGKRGSRRRNNGSDSEAG